VSAPAPGASRLWTARLRSRTVDALPAENLLPDTQPAYVASWIYVFGALTLAALVVVIASGIVLALGGPTWWHTNALGHYLNSLHLWGVELFFFFMVVHLWGKFFMAAWRGRRVLTWITGVVAFLVSIATAFTGYLVQTNFDSQWIGGEAKDGINATGAGAFWNVLDTGQMLLWHIMLLPLGVGILVVLHVILVRVRGVVAPFGISEDGSPEDPGTADRQDAR
jgi:quinol-cytochrome oxidoreductase complex cytochrome b subunit